MKTTVENNRLTLFPEGRIDSTNAAALESDIMAAVGENPGADIVIDAGNLEYISSAGLRVLMKLRRQAKKALPVVNVSPEVYDILEITGFTELLDVRRRLREVSVEGCKRIGRGAKGDVYRYDDELIIKVYNQSDPTLARHIHINHGTEIEKSIDRIRPLIWQNLDIRIHYSSRFLTIKYLANDADVERIIAALPNAAEIAQARAEEQARINDLLHTTTEAAIVDAKYAFIQGALSETYREHVTDRPRRSLTDRIDAVVTNKWAAFPIFIILLYIIICIPYTYNLKRRRIF